MNPGVRVALFVISACGLGALLLWGMAGLPPFGHYRGPYGNILNAVAPRQRHVTNVTTAVNYDYRGLDTLGEEFILFTAVAGVALVLRERHGEVDLEEEDWPQARADRSVPDQTEAVRAAGFVALGLGLVFAVYVIVHGQLTPGGGFQGGSILASAWALIYLAGTYHIFHKISPHPLIDAFDASGAGTYALVGLVTLASGAAFLENTLPKGTLRDLLSGGTISLINFAVGVEVAAGLILVLAEFLKQLIAIRKKPEEEDQRP